MSNSDPFSSRFEVFGRAPRHLVPEINEGGFKDLNSLVKSGGGDDGRIILLRAPRAGFGKTVLLQRVRVANPGSHQFIKVSLLDGRHIGSAHVLEVTLQTLCEVLPASGGLTILDLLARRILARGLEPLVRSGEVPCQDREGAIRALREHPVETFDFHHDRAVTAQWTKTNFEVLGPRLASEISALSGAGLRESAYWVELLFRFATTSPGNVDRGRLLFETIFRGDLQKQSRSGAGERLHGLLALLGTVVCPVLVIDDTEGLSTHPPDALELASFLTSVTQGCPGVVIILSVNGDVWETAFLPRLPGGLADRLTENEIVLKPLAREDAERLVKARAGAHSDEVLKGMNWEAGEIYARKILKSAGTAWNELDLSPSADGSVDTGTGAEDFAAAKAPPAGFVPAPPQQGGLEVPKPKAPPEPPAAHGPGVPHGGPLTEPVAGAGMAALVGGSATGSGATGSPSSEKAEDTKLPAAAEQAAGDRSPAPSPFAAVVKPAVTPPGAGVSPATSEAKPEPPKPQVTPTPGSPTEVLEKPKAAPPALPPAAASAGPVGMPEPRPKEAAQKPVDAIKAPDKPEQEEKPAPAFESTTPPPLGKSPFAAVRKDHPAKPGEQVKSPEEPKQEEKPAAAFEPATPPPLGKSPFGAVRREQPAKPEKPQKSPEFSKGEKPAAASEQATPPPIGSSPFEGIEKTESPKTGMEGTGPKSPFGPEGRGGPSRPQEASGPTTAPKSPFAPTEIKESTRPPASDESSREPSKEAVGGKAGSFSPKAEPDVAVPPSLPTEEKGKEPPVRREDPRADAPAGSPFGAIGRKLPEPAGPRTSAVGPITPVAPTSPPAAQKSSVEESKAIEELKKAAATLSSAPTPASPGEGPFAASPGSPPAGTGNGADETAPPAAQSSPFAVPPANVGGPNQPAATGKSTLPSRKEPESRPAASPFEPATAPLQPGGEEAARSGKASPSAGSPFEAVEPKASPFTPVSTEAGKAPGSSPGSGGQVSEPARDPLDKTPSAEDENRVERLLRQFKERYGRGD